MVITSFPMKLSRPSRFIAALIALFSILFMQLAVASYTCPAMNMAQDSDESVAMSMSYGSEDMSHCTGMDQEQPSLCHAYDHAGKQSLDKPELPTAQPFIPAQLVMATVTIEDVIHVSLGQPTSTLLARTTAPPLSIRNCCFRI